MPAMVRLTGEDAVMQLDAWWQKMLRSRAPWRKLIHVLKPFTPGEFNSLGYDMWRDDPDGRQAIAEFLKGDPDTQAHLENAKAAVDHGAPQVRIFFTTAEEFSDPRSPQRYAFEVLYPYFAEVADEEIYLIFEEGYRAAGLPVRDIDVNLWGASGVGLTGYVGGKLAWREFLPWWRWRALKERHFVLRVERFAREYGKRIRPAGLS